MTERTETSGPAAEGRPWMSQKEYHAFNRRRAVRCWLRPYLGSRLHPRESMNSFR